MFNYFVSIHDHTFCLIGQIVRDNIRQASHDHYHVTDQASLLYVTQNKYYNITKYYNAHFNIIVIGWCKSFHGQLVGSST